jgi:hypothetical protein
MPSLTAPTTLPAYLLDEQYSDSEFAQPYFQKKRPQTHPRRMVTPANDNFTSKLPQSQQHLVQDVSGTFRGIDASKTAGRSKTNVAASGIELKPPTSYQTPPRRPGSTGGYREAFGVGRYIYWFGFETAMMIILSQNVWIRVSASLSTVRILRSSTLLCIP